MSDPQDLVSIYLAANSIEASFVKNLLADEGIESVVTEINEPLAGLSIAPPDVMVRVADEQRARQFIADYEEKLIATAESDIRNEAESDEAEGDEAATDAG